MYRALFTSLFCACCGLSAQASLVTAINPLGRTISVQTATAGDRISLADLQTVINTRADRTRAGVFNSEGVTTAGNITSVEPEYATANFTLTGATRYGRSDASAAAIAPTSGGKFGFVNTAETWTLGTKISDGVTYFGATFSNWGTGAQLTSVTATYDDNSTSTFTSTATAGQYIFVGFKAPAGRTIRTIAIAEVSSGNWLAFDDIAIVLGTGTPPPPPIEITNFTIDPVTGYHTMQWASTLGKTYTIDYTLDGTAWTGVETVWDAQGTETIYINSKPPAATVQKYRITTE